MSEDERPSPAPPVAASNAEAQSAPVAWQPFTFGGVAALARARSSRVLLIELIVALLALAAILRLVLIDWFPVIDQAIGALPNAGRIEHRQLNLPLTESKALAENPFLAVVVDVSNSGNVSASSDVRLEFHRHQFQLCSLVGCVVLPYPADWIIEFNCTEMKPRWGAWQPFLLGFIALLTVLGLFLSWASLGVLYCPVAYVLGFIAGRNLTWAGAWRLASAALMPGALLITLGILLYASAVIDLLQLAGLGVVHVLLGWIYLVASPFFLTPPLPPPLPPPPELQPASKPRTPLPRPPQEPPAVLARSENPFAPSPKPISRNPFAASAPPARLPKKPSNFHQAGQTRNNGSKPCRQSWRSLGP